MDISALVPGDSVVAGWTRDGASQNFEGGDLYIYIDGGAEIYLEYGFGRVVVQDFKRSDGKSLSLEIFEMSGPESAYGMYSFKTSGTGRALEIGDGAELESYYLNFWKGPYVVTVTGFDEDERTLEGLVALAKSVEAEIPTSSEKPRLARALLLMGVEPGRIRTIKGLLGLASFYSFDTARGLDFKAGAGAKAADGNVLLVLEYDSASLAGQAFSELRDHLATSTRFKGVRTPGPERVVAIDGRDRPLVLTTKGAYLFAAIGTEPEKSRGLFDLLFDILTEIRSPAP